MNIIVKNVANKLDDVTAEWWRGAIIYQIYPRSFRDANNDGIGDLLGIIEKLDYVASLGVDGIWISPFFTSPMKDFGYDVADYCDIDPMFGTLNDFDELIAKAHSLGLKIIIDQVYSHTSDQHAWFSESRQSKENEKSNWYVWADAKPDGSPPNNWQAVFHGSAWTWDARRKQYYFHNFLPEQPDLNFHNPEVQSALLEVASFWLDRGVDGFRLDALNFAMHDEQLRDNPANPHSDNFTRPYDFQSHIYSQSNPKLMEFIEKLGAKINSYGGRFTVAEVGGEDSEKEMQSFIEGKQRLNTAYGFNFLYAEELSAELVVASLAKWPKAGAEYWPSWAFSNHDAPRVISRWARGRNETEFAKLCLLLLASLRGNLFLYQGEELGLNQGDVPFEKLQDPEAIINWPLTLGRDGARTPMVWEESSIGNGFGSNEPWLPIDKNHPSKAVETQETYAQSVLNTTRQIIKIRKQNPALVYGDIEIISAKDELLVFKRQWQNQTILCVLNLGYAAINYAPSTKCEILFECGGATIDHLPVCSGYWAICL